MQLLRDNLTLWTSDMQDSGEFDRTRARADDAAEEPKKEEESKEEAA